MSGFGHLVFAVAMMQVFGAPGDKASTSTIRSTVTSSVWSAGSSWSGQTPASSDTIIFPDSKEKEEIILPPRPKIRITPCPNGQTFCDDDDNYPSHYLRKIPRQYFDPYNNFFLNDTLVTEGLSTRIDGVDEQPLCLSKQELFFPKKAVATDKDTKLIVNTGNYLQGVRVELCMKEGSPCQFQESFPTGYTTVCRQKYIARKLVVVAGDGTGANTQTPLSTSEFLFPSCCVCKTKSGIAAKEDVQFPKKAVATDGTLQIVVNDGFYMQGVRVEVCLREGSPCLFDEAFPQGYTTVCKQKFIARKLVAISPGKNPARPIAVKDFLIPSCCVCSVIQTSINSRVDRGFRPSQ